MRSLLIFTLVLLSTVCQSSKIEREIKIQGTAIGYPLDTKVILINFDSRTICDTAYIMDGTFNFTVLNSEPAYYAIHIGNGARPDKINFFVEDVNISIYTKSGELGKAIVKGGIVQSQAEHFTIMNESITNRYNKASEEFNQAFRANDTEKADSLKKIVFNLRQERIDFGADYVNDNPDNIFSAFLLKGFIAGLPKSKIKLLYDNLSPLVKESANAISVASYLEYSSNVNVGDMAEDFELFDVNGNKVEFKNFKDKFVLLDFWAAACASCRIENKKLLTYYQRYKNKGLEIISISSDINPKEWKSASKEDSIVWTSLHDSKDENGHVGLRYNVRIIPSGFLIEPGGRIIAKDLRGEMLEVKLKQIFKE